MRITYNTYKGYEIISEYKFEFKEQWISSFGTHIVITVYRPHKRVGHSDNTAFITTVMNPERLNDTLTYVRNQIDAEIAEDTRLGTEIDSFWKKVNDDMSGEPEQYYNRAWAKLYTYKYKYDKEEALVQRI